MLLYLFWSSSLAAAPYRAIDIDESVLLFVVDELTLHRGMGGRTRQGFADSKKDGSISATDLASMESLLNGSRRVYLQGPKVGHGTPIYDSAIPRLADGTPLYVHAACAHTLVADGGSASVCPSGCLLRSLDVSFASCCFSSSH